MSLHTPSTTGPIRDCCVVRRRSEICRAKDARGLFLAVGPTVKPVGEPDAANRHVRFDERGGETERLPQAQATAPFLDSTPTILTAQ